MVIMVMKVICGFVYSADDYGEDSGGGGDGSRSWTDKVDKNVEDNMIIFNMNEIKIITVRGTHHLVCDVLPPLLRPL